MTNDHGAAVSDGLDALTAWAAGIGVTIGIEHDDDGVICLCDLSRDIDDDSTKGAGRIVMERLCRIADEGACTIETDHMRDAPGLNRYYASFGFSNHDVPGGYPHLVSMRRSPKAAS